MGVGHRTTNCSFYSNNNLIHYGIWLKMSKGLHMSSFTSGHSLHSITEAVINCCRRNHQKILCLPIPVVTPPGEEFISAWAKTSWKAGNSEGFSLPLYRSWYRPWCSTQQQQRPTRFLGTEIQMQPALTEKLNGTQLKTLLISFNCRSLRARGTLHFID